MTGTGTPLAGRRIAITRARAQASELAARLEALGAEVFVVPTISFADPEDWAPLDAALAHLDTFDWILFTSVNGVERTVARAARVAPGVFGSGSVPPGAGQGQVPSALRPGLASADGTPSSSGPLRPRGLPRIAAIGPATARALEERGLTADLVPAVFTGEGLADALPLSEMRGKKVLLARALVAREVLPELLQAAGAEVTVAPCYRTVLPDVDSEGLARRLRGGEFDAITFTSSSTVTNFAALFPEGRAAELLRASRPVCIGPVTASALRALGVEPAGTAEPFTISGLIEALLRLLR